jgi:hypothetical protein
MTTATALDGADTFDRQDDDEAEADPDLPLGVLRGEEKNNSLSSSRSASKSRCRIWPWEAAAAAATAAAAVVVPLRDLERAFPVVDSLEPLERAKADGSEEPARAVDDEVDGREDA